MIQPLFELKCCHNPETLWQMSEHMCVFSAKICTPKWPWTYLLFLYADFFFSLISLHALSFHPRAGRYSLFMKPSLIGSSLFNPRFSTEAQWSLHATSVSLSTLHYTSRMSSFDWEEPCPTSMLSTRPVALTCLPQMSRLPGKSCYFLVSLAVWGLSCPQRQQLGNLWSLFFLPITMFCFPTRH